LLAVFEEERGAGVGVDGEASKDESIEEEAPGVLVPRL